MKDFQGNVDQTEKVVVMDNNHNMTKADDKYTDAIDLSNACRSFYQARKRAAEAVKEKLANPTRPRCPKKKTSIDTAMETLRTEMASLMDQDLSLMKQLLTLNEAIEDLKWQKKYYHSDMSIQDSTEDLSESDSSVSETDMYESETEVSRKYPSPSSLSLQAHYGKTGSISNETTRVDYSYEKVDNFCTDANKNSQPNDTSTGKSLSTDFELFLAGNTSLCHDEQNSFDSGIHEPVLRKQIAV